MKGLQWIWAGGYIGEWTVLEEETKKQLHEAIADRKRGRFYLSARAHGIDTLQCIRMVNDAGRIGCDSAWISSCMSLVGVLTKGGDLKGLERSFDRLPIKIQPLQEEDHGVAHFSTVRLREAKEKGRNE